MLELKTIFTILHIFGAVIGAGAAFTSDYNFFFIVKDGRITKDEMSFLKNTSRMIWIGLLISILSGIGLFLGNPSVYLASSKFITKMIIVLVIAINGVFFHISHMPRLQKCLNQDLKKSKLFKGKKTLFVLSGAISVVSWSGALILGGLRTIPYSVGTAIIFYLIAMVLAFFVANKLTGKYFQSKKLRRQKH